MPIGPDKTQVVSAAAKAGFRSLTGGWLMNRRLGLSS